MAARVAVYTLRIMGPDLEERDVPEAYDRRNQTVVNTLPGILTLAEDTINDGLPEGYYAKIDGGS